MDKKEKEEYRKNFRKAVLNYLNFSSEHKKLAEEIAVETSDRACETYEESGAGTVRLTFDQQVALTARICIRHNYTAYDDMFIEKNLEQTEPFMDDPETDACTGDAPINEVSEFLKKHRP